MRLYSSDLENSVDIGMGSIWFSIYSTAVIALSNDIKKNIPLAISFLKNAECTIENVEETKNQMIKLREAFTSLSPDKVVYDLNKPNIAPPWGEYIAPTVTSCADLYTTADGKDLFTEVISLLSYAQGEKLSIIAI